MIEGGCLCFSVEYMKKKLDSDDTGVIVLENFLTEFFPFEVK